MKYNILIVEDNEILSNNINKYLDLEWINSKQLFSWEKVVFELVSNDYDAIILDIWLPDINWLELCENIREKWINIPILMLTARSETKDKIAGFESWTDDYLTKPFDYDELLMRLKALIRRNMSVKSEHIKLWDIEINLDEKIISKKEKNIKLSKTEFELFTLLVQNKWKVLSKEEIFKKVWWDYDPFTSSRKVDVYIGYLRKKLWEKVIETKRGEWYIIN